MATITVVDLEAQIAALTRRLAELEENYAPAGITEDEVLAISAAVAAYQGVPAHIRQIRLVSTSAWAQQERVSIQASQIAKLTMKLEIKFDGKGYEVDVVVAEPETPGVPRSVSGFNIGPAPLQAAAGPVPTPFPEAVPVNDRRFAAVSFPILWFGWRPGGAVFAAWRYSSVAGRHEDGD